MKMSETQPGQVAKQYGGNTRPTINHMERTDLPGSRQKIQKWDMIPDECFVQRMAGEFVRQTSNELFADKKVVLLFHLLNSTEELKHNPNFKEKF